MHKEPIQITANLATSLAVCDNWSPCLDAILILLLLEERQMASSSPGIKEIQEVQGILEEYLPLQQGNINGEFYWQCSSPHYQIHSEDKTNFRKRWDGHSDGQINWGKRKPQFKTSEGQEKSYDLALYLRVISRIQWFAVGNIAKIESLLARCTRLQKKRSQGYGQVQDWTVQAMPKDWHLWNQDQLMRPMPCRLISPKYHYPQMRWGWKAPYWLPENQELCWMPMANVI